MDVTEYQPRLAELVAELRERFAIPGAIGAVQVGDEVAAAAAGVLNVRTGVDITTDTLFLIGSITKVWTTTLVQILADEGALDLDVPVVEYLPSLRLRDPEVQARVTLRDLVSHRSGIEGDHFHDFGRGDDAVARYVESCAELRQLSPLGELFSYGNSGFVIAGRVIEVVTGSTWHEVLRRRLMEPLGLQDTVYTPEDAILRRTSVGHRHDPDGQVEVWPAWVYPWSMLPAGTSLCCSITDLLAFGRLHLNEGRAPDGTQIVSPGSVKAMQTPHIELPYPGLGSMGLGWFLYDRFGTPVPNHGGGSPGGLDYLYILPEHDLAFAFYANLDPSGAAARFGTELRDAVFSELVGIDSPPAVGSGTDPNVSVAPGSVVGRYVHTDATWTVEESGDGQLQLVTEGRGHITPFAPYRYGPYPLRTLTDELLELAPEGVPVGAGTKIVLIDSDGDGTVDYLHSGYRAFVRMP
ncbi:MAG TPA: serine hydrolase domain-containing protein [Nitriliruptorales bacterium]